MSEPRPVSWPQKNKPFDAGTWNHWKTHGHRDSERTLVPPTAQLGKHTQVVFPSSDRVPANANHDNEVIFEDPSQLLLTRKSLPGAVRDATIGSPDVTLTVAEPLAAFEEVYYSKPFQWRTELATALGLFHDSFPNYRRIKGVCKCSAGVGCVPPQPNTADGGSDICFHPAPAGQEQTVVSVFVTSAGSCIGSKSTSFCLSNSSCGEDGFCALDGASWQAAYARMQVEQKETMESLARMKVVDVQLQAEINAVQALGSGANKVVFLAAVALLVLVLGAVAIVKRVWLLDRLYACVPSLKSKGRQIKAKVRQVREEGRLSRHAQFAKMKELEEDTADTASVDLSNADEATHLDTGSGQLNSLWATKSSYDKPRVATVNPITAFFTTTTTTPQIVHAGSRSSDDLLRTQVMEEGGGGGGEEWSAFNDAAEDQVRLLREMVGSTPELSVEIEFEPSAIASRRPTLVQTLIFRNTSESDVAAFTCKAAVPKYMQVQITPPSSSTIQPNAPTDVTQTLRLSGVDPNKPIKVRLKLEYTCSSRGGAEETIDVNIGDLPAS